jgi:hypothetical protein
VGCGAIPCTAPRASTGIDDRAEIDIAGRFTNLLRSPNLQAPRLAADVPIGLKGSQRRFLEERLIHRTSRGEMVRSKNELVIANILFGFEKEGHLKYQVEPRLPFDDSRGRWADFLIEANGESWYWEHCGRLDDENYRRRWDRKLKLYANNGFTTYSSAKPQGRLIVAQDGPELGLDSKGDRAPCPRAVYSMTIGNKATRTLQRVVPVPAAALR